MVLSVGFKEMSKAEFDELIPPTYKLSAKYYNHDQRRDIRADEVANS
jgi:hypothetical protein